MKPVIYEMWAKGRNETVRQIDARLTWGNVWDQVWGGTPQDVSQTEFHIWEQMLSDSEKEFE